MLYRSKFSNFEDIRNLKQAIDSLDIDCINIMEVCGTHTMSIAAAGIKQMLPKGVRLISGPGCPVCVTPSERIDDICKLSKNKNIIITTYGDMLRVPGTKQDISLERSRINGADIRIVYSSMDALSIAESNPEKEVVFLGIGFETTAPSTGIVIKEAFEKGIMNFSVFCLHKKVEPAIRMLIQSNQIKIDGFLLPGHVGAVIGEEGFRFLEDEYGIPGVIAGFEPADILKAILMVLYQKKHRKTAVENEYTRVVGYSGNTIAQQIINDMFTLSDDIWRGLGTINSSGLKIRDEYSKFDAAVKMNIDYTLECKETECRCGDILTGLIEPDECPLFGSVCMPESPVGPCMVSSEGTCAAAYKYR